MPRQSRLPDTHSDLLKQIAGWRRIDRGFNAISGMFASSAKAKNIMSEQAMLLRQGKQRDIFSGFSESLRSARGKVEGVAGQRIDRAIKQFNRQIQAKGGANISQKDLSGLIGTLHSKVKAAAPLAMGMQKEYVGHLLGSIRQAKKGVMERGVLGLAQGHDLLDSSVKRLEAVKNLPQSQQLLGKVMRNARGKVTDAAIARRLGYDQGRFHREFNQARNLEEKREAAKHALERNEALRKTAKGDDAKALKEVSAQFRGFLKSSSGSKGLIGVGQKLAAGLRRSVQAIGAATQVIRPLKNAIGDSIRAYTFVNEGVNRFARSQMMITSERAAYGRTMRGAGMNFSSMMSAINTGRRAGMEDSAVVDKMATMQEKLARSRWGEGTMIDDLGKWGLTPFDESGGMKDFNRVMIDISNKFNELGSDMERLQFLSMQGFSPDQMEFVKNYARDAKEWEYKKQNPHLMGVLDQSRILDESGDYARIDAATKMELKRRQILNQNAIDEGLMPGIKRMLHPENWFFQDWTARKRGVEVAKSEKATQELTKELVRLRSLMKDQEGGIGGKETPTAVFANPEVLQGLGLSGGWAAADIANLGDKSGVHILRQLYAQQMGLKNLDDVESSKRTAAGVSSIIGILGGIAASVAIIATGGVAAIPMAAIAGGALAAGGMAIGGAIENSYWDDGSVDHIVRLRAMAAAKDRKGIKEYARAHNLVGLSPEMILSEDFKDDEKAAKYMSGVWFAGQIMNAQKLTDKPIDIERAKNFAADKYLKANKMAAEQAGRKLDAKEVQTAIARAGSGDSSIGIDERTAWNYIKYGYDEDSEENLRKRALEFARIKKQKQKEGLVEGRDYTDEGIEEEARQNARKDWAKSISLDVYEKARRWSNAEDEKSREQKRADAEGRYETIKRRLGSLWDMTDEQRAEEERKARKTLDDVAAGKRIKKQEATGMGTTTEIDITDREIAGAQSKMRRLAQIQELKKKYGNTKEEIIANMMKENIDDYLGEKPTTLYSDADTKKLIEDTMKSDKVGSQLSYAAGLKRAAGKAGISLDRARNTLFTDQEAKDIEGRLAAGETLDESTRDRYEEYKQGSDYQSRQRKQKADAKKASEETSRKETEREEAADFERRFGKGASVGSSIEKPKSEAVKRADLAARLFLGEKSTDAPQTAAGGEKPTDAPAAAAAELSAKDIKVMRKARALGYNLSEGGYTQEQIGAFQKGEEERKHQYIENKLGSEEDFKEFSAIESAILSGQEVDDADRKKYESVSKQLEKLPKSTPSKPKKPTSKSNWEGVSTERERQKSIAQMTALRNIDKFIQKGGTSTQAIEKFGIDRWTQYEDAQRRDELPPPEEPDKKKVDPYSKEDIDIEPYSTRGQTRLVSGKGRLPRVSLGGGSRHYRSPMGRGRLEAKIRDKRLKGVSSDIRSLAGTPSLREEMQKKREMREQMQQSVSAREQMQQKVQAANQAADSGKEANAQGISGGVKNLTMNMGGMQLQFTINFSGPVQYDDQAKSKILQIVQNAAPTIRDKVSEALTSATRSQGGR